MCRRTRRRRSGRHTSRDRAAGRGRGPRRCALSHCGPSSARNCATVIGSSSSDEAKIGGMTPEALSFSGRCEASPWNMRLPICRLGYWISRRRCARSMKTMAATTRQHQRQQQRAAAARTARPGAASSSRPTMALGRPATMPAMMMSDVPLPTPRAVICSPSHIRNMVPPTSVTTVVMRKNDARVHHHRARRAALTTAGRRRCRTPGTRPGRR